jgi:uncharacterized protein YbjT (DUF2867 family)
MEEVRKKGLPFRAMYRNDADAGKAPSGVSAVLADFADKASLRGALAGVDAVYLVCSPIPQLVELESNVVEACRESGVKYIALNSALGAGDYPKSFPSWHRRVEDKLKAAGVSYTIFRPNSFMQNVLTYYAPSIRTSGAFYAAMGSARVSLVDMRDVAAVIAKALGSPGEHAGKVYEFNGPEAVSYTELGERIARIANRAAKYVDIPEAAQRKNMLDMGMPEWQVNALLDLQQYYTQGQGGEITDTLPSLLGRAPTRLDQFLTEFKSQFNQ